VKTPGDLLPFSQLKLQELYGVNTGYVCFIYISLPFSIVGRTFFCPLIYFMTLPLESQIIPFNSYRVGHFWHFRVISWVLDVPLQLLEGFEWWIKFFLHFAVLGYGTWRGAKMVTRSKVVFLRKATVVAERFQVQKHSRAWLRWVSLILTFATI